MDNYNESRWHQFNSIIDSTDFKGKEKDVLLTIFRYVDFKKGYAHPSRAKIKELNNIYDNRTLDKILNSLIEKGYLRRESGNGVNSKYYILLGGEIPPGSKIPQLGGKIPPGTRGENSTTKRKEKEKEIDRYIKENLSTYQSIISLYFSLIKNDDSIKDSTLTIDTIKGCLEGKGISIIQDYIENSNVSLIEEAINNYSNMVNDTKFAEHNNYYSKNIMTLSLLINNITKFTNVGAAYQEYETFKNAALTTIKKRRASNEFFY